MEHFGNLSTVFGGKDPGDQLVEADATVAVPEEEEVKEKARTGWYTNGKTSKNHEEPSKKKIVEK